MSKRYRRGPLVLDHVSIALEPGTLTQLRGGNGSGKSTLLRVACGFSRPTSGRVHRGFTTLGFVPDRALPPARMTARDYLNRLGQLAGLKPLEIVPAAEGITERLGLDPGLDVRIGELSRGNQRKVLLTQALMRPADLLVLDEPFTALDATAAAALAAILGERVERSQTLLVAIHGDELGSLGRVLMLDAGHVVETAAASVLPARLAVVELAGPQPDWAPRGEQQPDGRTRYLVPERDVERLLAAALAVGSRVLRVGVQGDDDR